MNTIALRNGGGLGEIIENVLVKGDLGKLSSKERADFYGAVCQSVGLNPLTQPFAYITLNGKLTLYALRNCTDQLRAIHKVSVTDMSEAHLDGTYVVTCKVANPAGRTDMAKGAVHIAGLKGDALANALMKAETKAKRRATLSICGLSLLDEAEVEDIPAAEKRQNPHVNRAEDFVVVPGLHDPDRIPDGAPDIKPLPKKNARADFDLFQKELNATKTVAELEAWGAQQANRLQTYPTDWRDIARGLYVQHKTALAAPPTPVSAATGEVMDPPTDPDEFLKWAETQLGGVSDPGMVDPVWDFTISPHWDLLDPAQQEELQGIRRRHERRLGA